MVLVLAVAAYEELRNRDAVPKLRFSGTVTQWSTLDTSERARSLRFRLETLPHELAIDAPALQLLSQQGITEPLSVGSHVDAIVAKSAVAAHVSGVDTAAIPVLALLVDSKLVFGSPEALRLAPSMRVWPYLLLVSAFGASVFFRRSTRRRSRRVDYDEEDSSSG
jgi:hypothetical protein